MIEFGKIIIISVCVILFLCSCTDISESNEYVYDKVIIGVEYKSYKNNESDFIMFADTVTKLKDEELYKMINVVFEKKNDSDNIKIESKYADKSDSLIVFRDEVVIYLEDSMIMFTDNLFMNIYEDSVSTVDSIYIVKKKDRMKTKGFLSDSYFKRIEFYNPMIIYDED